VFHQRRATLDEIAAVIVADPVDLAFGGPVDMAAEDAVHLVLPGVSHDRLFELPDKRDGVFYLALRVGAERPVAQPETPPQKVHRLVEPQQELVAHITDVREPLDVLNDRVELVAMDDQQLAPIRGAVQRAPRDRQAAVFADVFAQQFIVVAGNIDNPGAFASFAQDFLDHVVVGLRPVAAPAQTPDIEQIADDIEGLELVIAQELQDGIRVAAARPQMEIGDPASAEFVHSLL
jgi:hypothetical protein